MFWYFWTKMNPQPYQHATFQYYNKPNNTNYIVRLTRVTENKSLKISEKHQSTTYIKNEAYSLMLKPLPWSFGKQPV